MHLNYYFLNHLSQALKSKIIGFSLVEAYIQTKNEAVLRFEKQGEDFFLKLNYHSEFTAIAFPNSFSKNKKGTYAIFSPLQGLKILAIEQHQNDRSFHLTFENTYTLVVKLHGSRSNLILLQDNNCVDLLNKKLENDSLFDLTKCHKKRVQDLPTFLDDSISLREQFPGFDKQILEQLELKGFSTKTQNEKWTILQETLDRLNKGVFQLGKSSDGKLYLSLFPFPNPIHSTTSAIEACQLVERYIGQTFYFQKEQVAIANAIQQQLKKHSAYLEVATKKLNDLTSKTPYEHIANIIMANLHQLSGYLEEVTLMNFYTETLITIKLKKELSPQKNAEQYYRKSKNKKIEVAKLEETCQQKKIAIEELNSLAKELSSLDDLKALRKFEKDHGFKKEAPNTPKVANQLFKRFEIEGYEILVGKNAKNNDLLTQKHSFKEDLWLHARDVTGSHVLLKYKAGKKFPKSVIEKAAQLAAYFSKRKTDSLCPVIVTPKKYVRKAKGALDGQVIVEREEVIMVLPSLIL